MFTACMNPLDLTVNQLKRAAAIKEQIEDLNKELTSLLGVPAESGAASKQKRSMSISGRKNIAAAQRARWARVQAQKTTTPSTKTGAAAKKKRMSRATKAKLSARMRAYWKAKKTGNR
jgi:hypothetical protein